MGVMDTVILRHPNQAVYVYTFSQLQVPRGKIDPPPVVFIGEKMEFRLYSLRYRNLWICM
jgi:hypothetical protein